MVGYLSVGIISLSAIRKTGWRICKFSKHPFFYAKREGFEQNKAEVRLAYKETFF